MGNSNVTAQVLTKRQLQYLLEAYDVDMREPLLLGETLRVAGMVDANGKITNAGRDRVEACLGIRGPARAHFPPEAQGQDRQDPNECNRCHAKPGVPRYSGSYMHGIYCDHCWHTILTK